MPIATKYHRIVQVPKDAFRLPLVLVDWFAQNCPVRSVVPDEVSGGLLLPNYSSKKDIVASP